MLRTLEPLPSSSLAKAGFIISLIALLSGCIGGGVFAPVGLTLSIVATVKRPSGRSIAGIVMGALGTLWLLSLIATLPMAIESFRAGIAQANDRERVARVEAAVRTYYESKHTLPQSLEEVRSAFPQSLHKDDASPIIHYTRESEAYFILRTPGPDGAMGTSDDSVRVVDMTAPPRSKR